MVRTIFAVLIHPSLFWRGLYCIGVILSKFFFFQYKAALFPRKIPVSRVEHPLDDLIPFNPNFVRIYLDFVAFWVRIVGFLAVRSKQGGVKMAAEFIASITRLYFFALEIYGKNLSTTERPNYTETFRFKLIHAVDPHLMCIPSLHVMIVIHGYTAFRHYARELGEEDALQGLAESVYAGALAITQAILYIKQHSINCVAAALYTMRRFDTSLFSAKDAETFVGDLFRLAPEGNPASTDPRLAALPADYAFGFSGPQVSPADIPKFNEHIMGLYRSFLDVEAADWTEPVLKFLASLRSGN